MFLIKLSEKFILPNWKQNLTILTMPNSFFLRIALIGSTVGSKSIYISQFLTKFVLQSKTYLYLQHFPYHPMKLRNSKSVTCILITHLMFLRLYMWFCFIIEANFQYVVIMNIFTSSISIPCSISNCFGESRISYI